MTTDLQLRLALISLRMIVFILFQVTILPQTENVGVREDAMRV